MTNSFEVPEKSVEQPTNEVEVFQRIEDEGLRNQIFGFYQEEIGPLNVESPFIQTLPREMFDKWMEKDDVFKLVIRQGDEIKAMAILCSSLKDDFWLSEPYFAKRYEGRPVLHAPCFAVKQESRDLSGKMALNLVRKIYDIIPDNGVCLSVAPEFNKSLPILFRRAVKGGITYEEIGRELCTAYEKKPLNEKK